MKSKILIRKCIFSTYWRGLGLTFTLHLYEVIASSTNLFQCSTDKYGKQQLAYKLFMKENNKSIRLFEGSDYYPCQLYSIDGNDYVRGLMNFLTLKPGDTDSDYFKDYTPTQLAYCSNYAEDLAMCVLDKFGEE